MKSDIEKKIYKKYIVGLCKKILIISFYNFFFFNRLPFLTKKKNRYIADLKSLNIDSKGAYRSYRKIAVKSLFFNKCKKARQKFNNIVDLGYIEYLKFIHPAVSSSDNLSNSFCQRQAHLNEYPYKQKILDIDLSDVSEKLSFPTFVSIDVSIVIPCYNNFKITMQCLRSVLKNTKNVNYEVIIADDKSTDEVRNITDYVDNIIYVKNSKANGFVNNCNAGAAVARGKYFYFLNNDTQVQPGYLDSLFNLINHDESIGIVGSMLVFSDGTLQEAGGQIFRDASGSNVGRGATNIEDVELNYVRDTDYISGAGLMIRADLFKELNGFDELYAPAYYEDSDLCLRVWYWKQKRVVFQPLSRVVHFEGQSFPSERKQRLMDKNGASFFNRFFNELAKYHCSSEWNSFVYKDHSVGKKQMLVIDWKILSPSFDTGSRVTFQYMQLFRKMGMNVKYYPMDVYLEKQEFLTDIEQLGIEVVFEQLDFYLTRNGKYFDYVFINRPDITERYINLIRRTTRAYIIYQGHDLHYLRRYKERKRQNDPNAEKILLDEKKQEFDIISYTDLPCFVSKDETDLVNKAMPKCHCISLPIFILDSAKMSEISYDPKQRKDICFVAGFKHTPNVDGALWFVKKIFPIVKKSIPDLKVYLIGSSPTEEIKALNSDDVIVTGYVTDERLKRYYAEVKMSVIPLNFGAGVKGKTVESVYNKVPVLTTSIGAEGIDNSSYTLTIEDDAERFANMLVKMYQDDELLQKISDRSVEFIETQYTEKAAREIFDKYVL